MYSFRIEIAFQSDPKILSFFPMVISGFLIIRVGWKGS